MKINKKLILTQIIVGGLIFLIWELIVSIFPNLVDPNLFGKPSLIWEAFVGYWQNGLLFKDTITTIIESAAGLAIGMLLGFTFGVVLASLPYTYKVFEPYIIALNSLPRPALAPIFLLWLGLGTASKILVSFSLVFFIVFFNTFSGVRSISRELKDAVRVTGVSRWRFFHLVTLHSVYSWLFAGFKTSVSFSLIGAVVGEFVGSSRGLGYRMIIATGILDTQLAYAILIWLAVLGVLGVMIGSYVERRVLRWQQA